MELEVVLEALLHLVGDRVGRGDIGLAIDGDRHFGVPQVRGSARADSVGALHARHAFRGLPDLAGGESPLIHETGTVRPGVRQATSPKKSANTVAIGRS